MRIRSPWVLIIPLFIGILRTSFIPGKLGWSFFSLTPPEVKVPQGKGLVHLSFSLILSAFPFSWLFLHPHGCLEISFVAIRWIRILGLFYCFVLFLFLLVGAKRVEFLFYKSDDQTRDLQDHVWLSFCVFKTIVIASQHGNVRHSPPGLCPDHIFTQVANVQPSHLT